MGGAGDRRRISPSLGQARRIPEEETSAPRWSCFSSPGPPGQQNTPFPCPSPADGIVQGAAAGAGPPPASQSPHPAGEPGRGCPSRALSALRGPAGAWPRGATRGEGLRPLAGALCPVCPAWLRPCCPPCLGVLGERCQLPGAGRAVGGGDGRGAAPVGTPQPLGQGAALCPQRRRFAIVAETGNTCCLSGTYVRDRHVTRPKPAPSPLPTCGAVVVSGRAHGPPSPGHPQEPGGGSRVLTDPARFLPCTHPHPASGRAVVERWRGDGGRWAALPSRPGELGWSPGSPLRPAQPSPRLAGLNPFLGRKCPGCA